MNIRFSVTLNYIFFVFRESKVPVVPLDRKEQREIKAHQETKANKDRLVSLDHP